MKRRWILGCGIGGVLAATVACSDDENNGGSDDGGAGGSATGGGGSGGGAGGASGAVCTEPTEVPCSDEAYLEMNLQTDLAPGLIENAADGAGWTSTIDATAGGAFTTDPDSYLHGRFGDSGLEKVEISDEDSLDSMDWDIGFRRYVVRINSGHSGPSCVTAARLPGTPSYDDVDTVPDGLTYYSDEYFTASCEFIPDGSGLPNSPATALSSYWTYTDCLEMTGNVFIVRLADGRHLKLTVTNYYYEDAQEQCQSTGTVPDQGSGAANIVVRWALLP